MLVSHWFHWFRMPANESTAGRVQWLGTESNAAAGIYNSRRNLTAIVVSGGFANSTPAGLWSEVLFCFLSVFLASQCEIGTQSGACTEMTGTAGWRMHVFGATLGT
jgi:hypothetical protein